MIINRNEQFDDSELREAYETGFIREREPGFERAEEPGEFNPNGPGVFGFNACAKCGTAVDINGLDMDNRKHFNEADGGCAGFAKADLERIKTQLSTIENVKVRQWFKETFLTPVLAQIEKEVAVKTEALQEAVIPDGQMCQEAVVPAKYKMPNGTIVTLPGGYKYPPEHEWIKNTGRTDCPHVAVGIGVLSSLAEVEGCIGYVCAGHNGGELPTVTLEEIERSLNTSGSA